MVIEKYWWCFATRSTGGTRRLRHAAGSRVRGAADRQKRLLGPLRIRPEPRSSREGSRASATMFSKVDFIGRFPGRGL